jgi:hypothetical protein
MKMLLKAAVSCRGGPSRPSRGSTARARSQDFSKDHLSRPSRPSRGSTARVLPYGFDRAFSTLLLIALVAVGVARPCCAIEPDAGLCVGPTIPVSSFRLLLAPASGGPALPIASVNRIEAGETLEYAPVHLPSYLRNKARIAVMLVSSSEAGHNHVTLLPAMPASTKAHWKVAHGASLVGVVFGPHGLDTKKVDSLVRKDPDLVPELARYAKETATVNALIQTLSQYEQAPPGTQDLNAALQGFSSQYNVALPLVASRGEPSSMQAALLLQGVLPSLSAADPASYASAKSLAMEQSAGLAAAVAALFYGTPAILAVGGAGLFQSLRVIMFPNTDLRGAFAQFEDSGDMQLCSNDQPPKPRSRLAYVWVMQISNAPPPVVSLDEAKDLAQGTKAAVRVKCATNSQLRLLPRARDWRLVAPKESVSVPAKVTVGSSWDTVSLDLSKVNAPAGSYHLAALWDWSDFSVAGMLHLRPFSNFASVQLTPQSKDLLIQGTGPVKIRLTGADFEFVHKVALVKADQPEPLARPLSFTLPKANNEGEQLSISVLIDTSTLTAGDYNLLLTQSNDKTQSVPVALHPPDPKLDGLPLRANVGLKQQSVFLQGTSLERIEQITSKNATWKLAPLSRGSVHVTRREAIISLEPGARVGDLLTASMQVEGLQAPIDIPDVVQVAGPLPVIVSVKESFPRDENVALHAGEIPASTTVSFAIRAQHLDSEPAVNVACASSDDTRQPLELRPGDRTDTAQLDNAGEGLLFLSLQPGAVGRSGCSLTVSATDPDAGTSMPYTLGTVIRLPRIDKFALTDKSAGRGLYLGTLTGLNLQMIVETGWNDHNGSAVQGIPTPVPGRPQEQTLEIEMPWPPPSPRAPVYIWLLGETQGRRTNARY